MRSGPRVVLGSSAAICLCDPATIALHREHRPGTDRILALKVSRNPAQAALERSKSVIGPTVEVGPILVERFGHTMREKLPTGDVPFRKAYLGSILDRVEVDDHAIRIVGCKDVLEQAVLAGGGLVPTVRSFVRKWRTRQDSNL